MKRKYLNIILTQISITIITFNPPAVIGQNNNSLTGSILMQNYDVGRSYINLQFLHPKFKTFEGFSSIVVETAVTSGSYSLTGSIPRGENSAIHITLPYHMMNQTITFKGFDETIIDEINRSGIGNVKVSYVQKRSKKNARWQSYTSFGANIPTASEDAAEGALDNYYDIFSFLDESMALHGSIINVKTSDKMTLSVEYGPDFWIPIGEDSDDSEFFLHYGIGVTFIPVQNVSVRGEWVGLGIISEDDIDFTDRWQHQFALGAKVQKGNLITGVFFMKNRGDLGDIFDSALGMDISYEL